MELDLHWLREDLSKELRSADSPGLIKEDGTMDLRKLALVSWIKMDQTVTLPWKKMDQQEATPVTAKLSALQIAAIQWQWVQHQSLIDVLNKCLFEQFKVQRYVYCTIHITSYIIMLENPTSRRKKHNMALRSSFTQNTHKLPPGGFEWQSSLPWHDWHQVGSPPVATNYYPLAVWNPGTHFGMSHWSIHPSHPSQCGYFGSQNLWTAINAFISFTYNYLVISCHTANCNCLAAWCDEQKCSKHRRIWPRPEWESFESCTTQKTW